MTKEKLAEIRARYKQSLKIEFNPSTGIHDKLLLHDFPALLDALESVNTNGGGDTVSSPKKISYEEVVKDIPLIDRNENNILSELSAQLIMGRIGCGMRLKDFAKFLGVSKSMLLEYENGTGNPSVKEIADIFAKLNIRVDLTTKEEENENATNI